MIPRLQMLPSQHLGRKSGKIVNCAHCFFCPEKGCKSLFETKQDFEDYLLKGTHEIIAELGVLDIFKKSFVSGMKAISQATQKIYSSEAQITELTLESACREVSLMSMFSKAWMGITN